MVRVLRMGKTATVFTLLIGTCAFGAPGNMIGRQSQNEGILLVPAPGNVTIDGDLKDWDLSGRIWVFADKNVFSRFSAEVSAMWTAACETHSTTEQAPPPGVGYRGSVTIAALHRETFLSRFTAKTGYMRGCSATRGKGTVPPGFDSFVPSTRATVESGLIFPHILCTFTPHLWQLP